MSTLSRKNLIFELIPKRIKEASLSAENMFGISLGNELPAGTYFYVLKCLGKTGEDIFKGAVTILR